MKHVLFIPIFCVFGGQNGGPWPPIQNFLRDLCRWPKLEAACKTSALYFNYKDKRTLKSCKKREKMTKIQGVPRKLGFLTHLMSKCQWDFLICFSYQYISNLKNWITIVTKYIKKNNCHRFLNWYQELFIASKLTKITVSL